MNIKVSFPALLAVVALALAAQPAFAQSDKEGHTEKTYKRKFYNGKDADKYRAMNDVKYREGRRSDDRHEDDNEAAGSSADGNERRHTRENRWDRPIPAKENAAEQAVAAKVEVADRDRERERDRDENAGNNVEPTIKEQDNAGEHVHTSRREVRGNRKEMRRKAREEKWIRPE